jgi:hypothetical protein
MSQYYNGSGGSGGSAVSSAQGTAPITVNGVSGTPETGAVTVALTTPLTVQYGGTGDSSLTAYAVLCGGTTNTGAVQSIASVGTSGQVLTSNGAAMLPTFQSVSGGLTGVFAAILSATQSNVTGDGTVFYPIFNTATTSNAAYNTATGIYTAPSNGTYFFNVGLFLTGFSASHISGNASFQDAGSGQNFMEVSHGNYYLMSDGLDGNLIVQGNAIFPLTAGQEVYVNVQVNNGMKTISVFGTTPTPHNYYSYFGGGKLA